MKPDLFWTNAALWCIVVQLSVTTFLLSQIVEKMP